MAKKPAPRSTVISDLKYMGKEPMPSHSNILTISEMIRIYNWYNAIADSDQAKTYLRDYAKSKSATIYISNHDNNTFAWLARMVFNGFNVGEDTLKRLDNYFIKLSRKPVVAEETVVAANKTIKTERSVMDKWLADIEDAIDNFEDKFNFYNYAKTNEIPQKYIKLISEIYEPQFQEIQSLVGGKDKDLTEAYKGVPKARVKLLMQFYKDLKEDCDKFLDSAKNARKPRKKVVKSAEVKLKHFRYQKSCEKLKITSQNPTQIFGSKSMYVLNTKTNVLTMFVSNGNGLDVNRSSIINFDEKLSKSRKIGRSLLKTLEDFRNSTKRSRPKLFEAIKTADSAFTNRLNETSIIMFIDN